MKKKFYRPLMLLIPIFAIFLNYQNCSKTAPKNEQTCNENDSSDCSSAANESSSGLCGFSTDAYFSEEPQEHLCLEGTYGGDIQKTPDQSGSWGWSCRGTDSEKTAFCKSLPAPGVAGCGPAQGQTYTNIPADALLCLASNKIEKVLPFTGDWKWTCRSQDGTKALSCSAKLFQHRLNARCNLSDSKLRFPGDQCPSNSLLCSAGIPTENSCKKSNNGYSWQWTCGGLNGGNSVNCSVGISSTSGLQVLPSSSPNYNPSNGYSDLPNNTPSASDPGSNSNSNSNSDLKSCPPSQEVFQNFCLEKCPEGYARQSSSGQCELSCTTNPEQFYLTKNPDVAKAINTETNYKSGFDHWCRNGRGEGRDSCFETAPGFGFNNCLLSDVSISPNPLPRHQEGRVGWNSNSDTSQLTCTGSLSFIAHTNTPAGIHGIMADLPGGTYACIFATQKVFSVEGKIIKQSQSKNATITILGPSPSPVP